MKKLSEKLKNLPFYTVGYSKDADREVVHMHWTVASKSGSGPSNWEDSCNCSMSIGDDQPEFYSLNEILKEHWPKISYFEFLELYSKLKKTDDYSSGGYYGDETIYRYHFIFVDELMRYIENHKRGKNGRLFKKSA